MKINVYKICEMLNRMWNIISTQLMSVQFIYHLVDYFGSRLLGVVQVTFYLTYISFMLQVGFLSLIPFSRHLSCSDFSQAYIFTLFCFFYFLYALFLPSTYHL